ncbi:pentatricopeptide repeat-containing protein At1g20230-like [Telopea speciosissima]|uniref:pentatricopeptide repeat-containing protein At1g20230-like n=1 Tax=Telopea speciosissima TaxID=54955 RepID=UPI001CC7117F|nr:pentatricopeptide repeat-containing protein At1g20230-like [Telopea speciosissima]
MEAKELVDRMPMKAGPSIWEALLVACQTRKNFELGKIAAKELFVLEPKNNGNYVLLSNMYAEVGRWEEVNNLRTLLKNQGVKKNPGCSWIEINGKAHQFFGGETSHTHSEEEKEQCLSTHSENLAIAFGLLNTSPGTIL